jgi:hypothetical protein
MYTGTLLENGVLEPDTFEFPIGKRFRIEFNYKEMLGVPKIEDEQKAKFKTQWLNELYALIEDDEEELPDDFLVPRSEWGFEEFDFSDDDEED